MTEGNGGAAGARHVHLFVYGTLRSGSRAAALLADGVRVRAATVRGTLYDLTAYPALVLAGDGEVAGEVWRIPTHLLPRLDAYEGVAEGLFRRVAVRVGEVACWTYVAGHVLGRELIAVRRIASGRWPAAGPPRPSPADDRLLQNDGPPVNL